MRCGPFHNWIWDEPSWSPCHETLQYATCSRCGKVKVGEVLL